MAHNLPYYGYYKYDVIPWLAPLLYERLNKEVKILSFRGYDGVVAWMVKIALGVIPAQAGI